MSKETSSTHSLASLAKGLWRRRARTVENGIRLVLSLMLLLPGLAFGPAASAQSTGGQVGPASGAPSTVTQTGQEGEEQEPTPGQQVM